MVSCQCAVVTLSLRLAVDFKNVVTVFEIFDFKYAVTLKTKGVRQGHWKCHHSIESLQLPMLYSNYGSISSRFGTIGPTAQQYAASMHTTPQSTTLGLQHVIHVPNYMDHYSFTDPWGMDGWVGHVGWPRADGLTTKWSPVRLAVWRSIGKVRRPRPAF